MTESRDPELVRAIGAMETLVFALPQRYRKGAVEGMRAGLLRALYKPWQNSSSVRVALEDFHRAEAGEEPD